MTDHDPRACNFCAGEETKLILRAADFDRGEVPFELHRCHRCGLVRTEPRLSGAELSAYYRQDYYGGGASKFTAWMEALTRIGNQRLAGKILSFLPAQADRATPYRILDIGCGRGNLLRSLAALGHDCHGVERAEFLADNPVTGFHCHAGDLRALGLNPASFDIAIMWHTLEHMEDPAGYLREVERLLRPGGVLALAVPNFDSLQAGLFRSHWFHLDLPRHLYHFGLAGLTRHLETLGLIPVQTSTLALDQNLYGFVQSLLNAFTPGKQKNHLYAVLKSAGGHANPAAKAGWLLLAGLVLPLALLELLVSGLLGRGATAIVFAEKGHPGSC